MLSKGGMPGVTVHETASGCQIAARVSRNVPPTVLLLHGIGSGSVSFRPQFDELGDKFELVAWDAPGYGSSSDAPTQPSMDFYADAAAELLTSMDLLRVHVVGVSWGGVIATRLSLRHPERVRSLSLISSTCGRRGNSAALSGLANRVASLRRDNVEAWATERLTRQVSAGASPELRRRIVTAATDSVRPAGFAAAATALAETDHRAELSRIGTPTWVLAGDKDPITGIGESQTLAAGIARSHLVLIQGGGHLLNQEKPAEVNAALVSCWTETDLKVGAEHG